MLSRASSGLYRKVPWNYIVRSFSSTKTGINFLDSEKAFSLKSTSDLLRGLLVFNACRVQPLVKYSDKLVGLSYKVFGATITDILLRKSFFSHFCAGEDEASIQPTIRLLKQGGVGSILDYAAEADILDDIDCDDQKEAKINEMVRDSMSAKVRIYHYKDEELCDAHVKTFEKCILAAASTQGFAAIKITALGNPELLKRASVTILELKKLFHRLDPEGTGYVSRELFEEEFGKRVDGRDPMEFFDYFDSDHDGKLDYIEWTEAIPLEELHLVTEHCTSEGPLSQSVLTEEEQALFLAMKNRFKHLASLAEQHNVRLMIDAEQTYFQPAIDNLVVGHSKEYNRGDRPVIFNTYQMYLKDAPERLYTDMERAKKGGYKFAAKLVRGAYMTMERDLAKSRGLPDPINATIEDTHNNYNDAVAKVLDAIHAGDQLEIMIASHNQRTIELCLERMEKHGLSPGDSGVHFGQLLGMADHLTLKLGAEGYKAYKYVPYGKVNEVMPYLLRRAKENSGMMGGAKLEIAMILQELRRRFIF